MNKKSLILIIIGLILIGIGMFYVLNGKNEDTEKPIPSEDSSSTEEPNNLPLDINFNGEYSYSDKKLYLYQNRYAVNELYFIFPDMLSGKIKVNDNEATYTDNNIIYKFTFDNESVMVEASDSSIVGTYNKVGNITEEDYFNLNYGSSILFNSQYNGIHYNDSLRIISYQSKTDEVAVFVDKLEGNKVYLKCKINDDESLSCEYNGNQYSISLHDGYNGYMLFSKIDPISLNVISQEKLLFEGEITKQDTFDLILEYQQ